MISSGCRKENVPYQIQGKNDSMVKVFSFERGVGTRESGCLKSGSNPGLTDLLGELLGLGLLQLGDLGQRLAAVDAASPVTTDLLEAVIEVVLSRLDDLVESALVLGMDVGERQSGAGLHSDDAAESGFALDDAVRHAHFAAESGQMHHQLNRVHVVGDHHELRLLLLHQSRHGVESVSDDGRSFGGRVVFAVNLLFRFGQKTLLLSLLALRTVLVQQLERLGGSGSVQGHGELVDGRRDLETLVQDGSLPLQDDILGPPDETGQIALGLDVLPDAEILRPLLEK